MPELLFADRKYCATLTQKGQSSQPAEISERRGYSTRGEALLTINTPYYDARAHGGNNIAHAILNGAMATLACQFAAKFLGCDPTVTAVIPANTAQYVCDVYKILGIPVLSTDGAVSGRKWQTNFDDSARIGLASQLLPLSLSEKLEANPQSMPKRIYIARQGARSISDADEVESLLKRQGFTIIYPEKLPVIEQLRYLWHADVIAGVHGAALAGLIFRVLKKDRHPMCLIELFGPGYVVTLYRHIVAAIGGQWIGVRGRVTPQIVHDLEVLQGRGFWDKLSTKLRGRVPGRFLKKEWAWQRTHQSTNLAIDPDALSTAIDLLNMPTSEPHPRLISFEQKTN